MSGRKCAWLTRMSRCSKRPRGVPKSWPPTIYKPPQRIKAVMLKVGLNPTPLDVPVSHTGRCPCFRLHCAKCTDGRHVSLFKQAPHDLNGYFHSTARVHDYTGHADGMHRTPQCQRPIDSSKVLERENTHWARPLGAIGCTLASSDHSALPPLTSFAPDADALHLVPCVRCHAKMHRTRWCTAASVRSLSSFTSASA
jgi:hypothetical protein